jgi:hypothetical protein
MNTRRYALPIAALTLFWGLILSPASALGQVCQGVSGVWYDDSGTTQYGYDWHLTQTGSSITGTMDPTDCSSGWSVTGTINSSTGQFSLTASGSGCPASWFTYSSA